MPRKADPALADSRRREILDAAARCFVRRGLHASSMREILAEAGLSSGAVYNYFDSKEAIIEAVAAIILECSADDARLSVELLAEASRNPRVHAVVTANDKALRDAFLAAIHRGQRDSRIPSDMASEILLETVVAIYEGFVGRIAFDPSTNRKQLAKAAKTVLNRLLAT